MTFKQWANQTSTRTALGGLVAIGAGMITGEVNTQGAVMAAIPILYGLAVSDKASGK